jgi:hypothetical protein
MNHFLFLVNYLTHVKILTMEKENSLQKTESYPTSSYRLHRKQRFWQILFPVMLVILLILAVAVFVVLTAARGNGGGDISIWADTSMILLILPVLVFAVLIVLVFLGLIYLVARLLNILPFYSSQAQYYADLVSSKIKTLAGKLVEPIIKVKSVTASINAVLSSLSGRFHK